MKSEEALGKILVSWLKESGWEVFQEVKHCGHVADVVAKKCNVTWVIEIKSNPCLKVLEQAAYWFNRCNFVSVCTLSNKNIAAFEKICMNSGIGLIVFGKTGKLSKNIEGRYFDPKYTISVSLCEQQKTYANAGNDQRDFFSPFKQTRDSFVAYVKANPGCTIKSVVESINHHYKTDKQACSALLHWIKKGVIGVVLKKKTKPYRLYVKD